jgi:two-component system, NtrC family, response regulator AtoC
VSRVAIVDDEPRLRRVLGMVLRRDGHEVEEFEGGHALLASDAHFDCVLTDLRMPGMDGLTLLGELKQRDPTVPVVVITAHGSIDSAVTAMKKGARDYLQKPLDNAACRSVVRRAIEHGKLHRENRYMRSQGALGLDVVAQSPAFLRVLNLARRAARSTATVLIQGDSGTGKELVARLVHIHSRRGQGPFVAVNCKAFASGVLESELFGHEKGAFTGASGARPGIFERASGGTLFLDEIGEIDADFQAKLLRVLQEGEVSRVGAQAPRKVDVRVVAATNRDLKAEVAAGRFREDLYFRLAVVPFRIPTLRERPEDVLPLARHFLDRCSREQGIPVDGWTDEVEGWIRRHDWPGNVRELRNTLERGVVLCEGTITLDDLLLEGPPATRSGGTLQDAMDEAATERIRSALAQTGGRKAEAAELLGVDRTTLYRLMRRLGL